jgi:hypothetical protein
MIATMTLCNASTSRSSTRFREPSSTPAHATGTLRRHALLGIALSLAVAACGGGKHTDSYEQATTKQQSCCDNLDGADRDQCLASLVTVEDDKIASTDANQASFRCVEAHFVCDPETGHATAASTQEQYDCIAELGQ